MTIHNGVSGEDLSPITYSRRPIAYKLLGRSRRYVVRDVVAYAKECFEQAPRRIPPQRPRKKRLRAAVPRREPAALGGRQHQPAPQPEKKTEPGS